MSPEKCLYCSIQDTQYPVFNIGGGLSAHLTCLVSSVHVLHAALEQAPIPTGALGSQAFTLAYTTWYDGPRAAALAKARGGKA